MSPSTDSTSSSAGPQASVPGQAARTLTFVVAAVACLGITVAIELASRPDAIKEFGKVGQQFYPDFTDPTLAAGLEVYAFDTQEVLPQEFIVRRQENDRWVIPSRHDYPADAEDQLAETAASVIGIERGAMVTRWPADHARYGVVNPRQDSLKVDEVEGVGQRVILTNASDTVLVDYIIVKEVESDDTGAYYVRHPAADEVYIATLNIDLSTKFSDWIDTDMLHINATDLVRLTINDYTFNEVQGTLSRGETSVLHREASTDPWVLDGLNEETEEVDTDAMTEAAKAIAEMKIVGVRPKQEGLTPDLRLDESAIQSRNDVAALQQDLLDQGFLLQPDEQPDTLKLLAREGELFASTSDGLVYRLYFGRAFTGSQEELELGFTNGDKPADSEASDASEDENNETADETTAASDETADGADESEADSENAQPGRYVFVRVEFQTSNLGEAPTEPVAPEMPEELKQAEESADSGEEGESEADESGEEGEEETEEDPLAELRQKWDSDQAKYEADKSAYGLAKQDYDTKVEAGTKKADELNRRFAEWYYVIPGESFDKLRLSRQDIVKAKEVTEESQPGDAAPNSPQPAGTDPFEPEPASEGDESADTEEEPADSPDSSTESEESASTEEPADGDSSEEPSDAPADESVPSEESAPSDETAPSEEPADPTE